MSLCLYSSEAQQVDAKWGEPFALQPGLLFIPYRLVLKQDPSHIDRLCMHAEQQMPSVDQSAYTSHPRFQGAPALADKTPTFSEGTWKAGRRSRELLMVSDNIMWAAKSSTIAGRSLLV